jgi:hypothetical protein
MQAVRIEAARNLERLRLLEARKRRGDPAG